MSNKIFCPKCFKSTPYESTAPSFCSHCGKSFIDGFESNASKEQPKTIITNKQNSAYRPSSIPKRTAIIEDINDDENIQAPNIDKIEVIIDTNLRPNRQKFESMSFLDEKPKPLINSKNKKSKISKTSEKEAAKIWLESFPKTNKNNSPTIGE